MHDKSSPLRAAGYVRVSTDEQAREGVSLADQEHRIAGYVRDQGWELTAIFRDEGVSGSIPIEERPGGREAFDADADLLVVVAWDRLGRDAADLLAAFRDREVRSVTEDREPPLLRDLRAVLAQEEKRTIIKRTKDAAAAMAREGRYNGSKPLGYAFLKEQKQLVVLHAEVPLVNRIFSAWASGSSLSQIMRELRAEGVTTQRGGSWRTTTLSKMLRNPVYLGKVRAPTTGEVLEGNHEGIVDPELFEKAQARFAAQGRTRGKGRGRRTTGSHLFVGGLLRCGQCGEAMSPIGRTDKYLCNGVQNVACDMPAIAHKLIDPAVYRYFEQVGLDVEATRREVEAAVDHRLAEVRALLTSAEREAQLATDRLAKVKADYTDGPLDAEEWQEFRAELEPNRDATAAKADRLRAQVADVEASTPLHDAESDVLEQLTTLRAAIAGEVTNEEGIAAARAALARLFSAFYLRRGSFVAEHPEPGDVLGDDERLSVDAGEFWIEPLPNAHAVAGYDEDMKPVLTRTSVATPNSNTAGAPPSN